MSNNWGCSCGDNRRRDDRMPCQKFRNERDRWDDRHNERRDDRRNWCNHDNNWRW